MGPEGAGDGVGGGRGGFAIYLLILVFGKPFVQSVHTTYVLYVLYSSLQGVKLLKYILLIIFLSNGIN